ncbi:hypothetical protein [Prosthecobacter dejongeii]|uniref:Uncharacterized protein n=1 Tax=Prosthecobacter dejongeii TaxID=48465 RepID=A0A7W7YJ49_9BACT|nr:hypothetical protein [Prosthecobacter dejongeii]MBB5036825.1 hypothetical protein [Prosthecobacter dejongeii]
MKTKSHQNSKDELDQLGGTDQIEQLAADLAVEDDRQRVTDKDREEALKQMGEMAPPPAVASPTAPPEGQSI